MRSANKSVCQALFVLVAVTLVSGQYLITTTYEDSSCTTESGVFTSENMGVDCTPNEGCYQRFGFYYQQSCVSADPFASPPTNTPLLYSYYSKDLSCTNYVLAQAVATLNKCIANRFTPFKLSGCDQNTTLTLTYYYTKTDCEMDNAIPDPVVAESNTCLTGNTDYKFSCGIEPQPVAPPMTAPVTAPVTPPIVAPVATTPSSGPVSAPVTATPKAATPVARTSSASNVMIGTGLVATMVLALA